MKEIIVRADDLGFSEGINYGIEKACRDGIIRSVGIMTNMPATRHGYDLVKDLPLCFGLHTNICAGRPITDPSLIPSICDENGNLNIPQEYDNYNDNDKEINFDNKNIIIEKDGENKDQLIKDEDKNNIEINSIKYDKENGDEIIKDENNDNGEENNN